jgi:hypothetical protein
LHLSHLNDAITVLFALVTALLVTSQEPAASKATIWSETVKRGDMLGQVRGLSMITDRQSVALERAALIPIIGNFQRASLAHSWACCREPQGLRDRASENGSVPDGTINKSELVPFHTANRAAVATARVRAITMEPYRLLTDYGVAR